MAAVDSFSLLLREIGRSYNHCIETLAVIGAFYSAKVCFTILSDTYALVRVHFIPRLISTPDFVKQYGKWAVVTGGTAGVGLCYAKELARRGFNLLLISQNREKLEAVAKEMVDAYKVKAAIVAVDLGRGREAYPVIKKALEGKEIGVLVNNAGVLYPLPDFFTSLTEAQIWELINANIGVANMMVHLVLPEMVERKRGAIVNVSFIGCFHLKPQVAALTASKMYLDHFSRALHYEYGSHGIFIQSLIPFFVCSNEAAFGGPFAKPSFFVPSAEEFTRHAITTLGVSRRTTGYWPQTLLMILARFLPDWIWTWGLCRLKWLKKSL